MVDMRVTLSGWTLDNPVIPASGTFGYGREFAELYDINILGSFSFKVILLMGIVILTAPLSAHKLGRAAYLSGHREGGMEHDE